MARFKFHLPDGRTATVTVRDGGLEEATAKFNEVVYPDMMSRAGDIRGEVQGPEGDLRRLPKKSSYDISGTASSPAWPTKYAIPRETAPGAAEITMPPPGPQGGGMPSPGAMPGVPPTPSRPPLTPSDEIKQEIQRERILQETKRQANPATGMPWYEKAGVGLNIGLENAATGIRDLIGTATPEEIEERKEREKAAPYLGGWGGAGEVIGETTMTLPAGGPLAKAGGYVLQKTIPLTKAISQFGGKILNVGAMGTGFVQGAVQEGLIGHADDKGDLGKRGGDALEGGAGGGLAPLALKVVTLPLTLGGKALVAVKNAAWPGAKDLQERAYDAIKKAIGDEGITNARRSMEHAEPPTIPLTSAGFSQSPGLGALERGARNRGFADFNAYDERAARSAWEQLQPLPGMSSDAGDVLRGTFMRNNFPKTKRQFGEASDVVPDVQSHPLRNALAKYSEHMHPDEVDVGRALAGDLAKRDIVKFGQGTITPNVKRWGDHIPMVIGGYLHAKTLGMTSILFNRVKVNVANELRINKHDQIMKEIDEALLDPQKFQTMVDEVRTRILGKEPLSLQQEAIRRIAEEATEALSRSAASKANN